MKPTSHLYLIGLFLILALAGGCSKGGEDIPTPPPAPTPTPTPPIEKDYITVNKDSLEVTCQGEDIQISFMTNHDWTASSNQSWCTLATTSGEKGNVALKATLVENTTFEKRMATITLKAGTASQKVVITQEAAEPDKLELETTSFTVAAEGKDIQIPFVTNVAWETSADQDWCTLSATSGEAGNQSIIAKIAKNKVNSERKAVITFKAGTASQKVVITQEAAEPDKLVLETTSFTVAAEGKDVQIPFVTDVAWEASTDQDWCTLSSTSGEAGTQFIIAKIAKNKVQSERKATITFKAGTASQKVVITQEAAEPDKLVLETTSFTVTAEGKDIQIPFVTNVAWETSADQDWCTLSATSGEAGNQSIIAKIAKNKVQSERKATITFKAGTASQKVVITQEAAEPDKLVLETTSFTVAAEGKDVQIPFVTDVAWEASTDQDWCTLSSTSGEAGTQFIIAKIAKNKVQSERKATITFKAGTASQKVVITQEAAEPDKLELVTTSFTVTAEGKDIQIPFVTDVAWEASADQDWCTLSSTSGEAGTQFIIAKIAKNKVKSERKAVITFKAGTATPQTVTITQEAAPPDEIEIKETFFQVGTEGKEIEISFTTNAAWMIASNQSWCTLSNSVGEEGTYTLTVTVDKNTSYEDRTATITLKAGEVQETITISQERKYQLKVTYEDTLIDYAGANVTVKIQCNTKYEMSFQADWLRQVKSRSMKAETLIFEVDRNDADKEREAEIIFFNQEKNLRETIKIRQEAKPEDTSVTPSGNIGNMTWG